MTKMFCSPNRSAHGLHGRKTVRVRAKINEHGTVLVNSTDPREKDPDSASFRADPHGSAWNGEAKYTKKLVSWDQRIPRHSARIRVEYQGESKDLCLVWSLWSRRSPMPPCKQWLTAEAKALLSHYQNEKYLKMKKKLLVS